MLLSVIKAECIKLRRAPVWIAFFVLPLLAAVMGTFNYVQNTAILQNGWYSLWTQHTLFASFFFLPSLLGVLCAYQWRLEHRANNWNSLMTQPVPRWKLLAGKMIVAEGFAVLALLFTGALYVICGKFAGLPGFPAELAGWLLLGVFAVLAIVGVQLLLSMLIKSFAIPVGIALVGGIVGLGMTSAGMGLLCPYALLAMSMNANGSADLQPSDMVFYFISCGVFALGSLALGTLWLRHRDIETK